MKVVSPATTSVLRFVPRSENLKKVRKVSISPLPFYVREKYSISAGQPGPALQAEMLTCRLAEPGGVLTCYNPNSGLFLLQTSQAMERSQRPIMAE
jgi:hypothetical protein